MLDSLRSGLQAAVKRLIGNAVIDEAAIKEFVRDLQRALIQADVNVKLVLSVTENVQKRALEEKPLPGMTRKDQIVKILYDELARLLGGEEPFQLKKDRANILVMLGVQGSGKTTTVSKLARLYTKKGFKVGVVAADTFRPGAVTQLKMLCEPIGVEVFSDEKQSDSVKVAEAGSSPSQVEQEHHNRRHGGQAQGGEDAAGGDAPDSLGGEARLQHTGHRRDHRPAGPLPG